MPAMGSAALNLLEGVLGFLVLAAMFNVLRQGIIGKKGIVLENGDPNSYAMINVNGQKWRALSENSAPLDIGEVVVVSRLKGLQVAIVEPSTADFPRDDSLQALPAALRVWAGLFAVLQIVRSVRQGVQGHEFASAGSLSLALLCALFASGVLRPSRRTFQAVLVVGLVVYAIFQGMEFISSP